VLDVEQGISAVVARIVVIGNAAGGKSTLARLRGAASCR
jgi:polynucleotide 5'-kinase involved in rRNA processing